MDVVSRFENDIFVVPKKHSCLKKKAVTLGVTACRYP